MWEKKEDRKIRKERNGISVEVGSLGVVKDGRKGDERRKGEVKAETI